MSAPYRVRDFTLTLNGSAQRLSTALPDTTVGGADDLPAQFVVLQPDGANGAAVFVGGTSSVSSTVYGFSLPAGAAGVPPPPFPLSAYMGRFRLSDIWVIGTNTQKLHVLLISP